MGAGADVRLASVPHQALGAEGHKERGHLGRPTPPCRTFQVQVRTEQEPLNSQGTIVLNKHPSGGLQEEREGASALTGLRSCADSAWGSAPAPAAAVVLCSSLLPPRTVEWSPWSAVGSTLRSIPTCPSLRFRPDTELCFVTSLSACPSFHPPVGPLCCYSWCISEEVTNVLMTYRIIARRSQSHLQNF